MMKKLSKIALLAAASAFMLAVFPACGDDDEEDDPKATLTLSGETLELETGKDNKVTATVTLEDDTFSADAKKIAAEHEISTDFFELKAGTGVTVSAATLVEWTSDTVAKISFTVTAAAGAADGTISAEIKEGTLSSNKTLTTTGNISYTIKSTGKDPVPSVEIVSEAESMTVEVEGTLGLMAEVSNFPEGVTYEWKSDNEDVATVVQNPDDETQARVTAIAAGTAKITVTAEVGETKVSADVEVTVKAKGSVGDEDAESHGSLIYNFDEITTTSDKVGETPVLDGKVVVHQTATGKIKITANDDGTHRYIQTACGGSSAMAPSHTNTTGYLAVKAAKAGKEKITFTFTTVKGGTASNNQIVLYDAVDGSQIGISDAIECPTTDSKDVKTLTIEATVPETFYVTFIRSAGKGGFKFSKIEQEY